MNSKQSQANNSVGLTLALAIEHTPESLIPHDMQRGDAVEGFVIRVSLDLVLLDVQGFRATLFPHDVSWDTTIAPVKTLARGQKLLVKVLEIRCSQSLKPMLRVGIKQLQQSPYLEFSKKIPWNMPLTGTVFGLTRDFARVRLAQSIEARLYIEKSKSGNGPPQTPRLGDVVDVYIRSFRLEDGRVEVDRFVSPKERVKRDRLQNEHLQATIQKWVLN